MDGSRNECSVYVDKLGSYKYYVKVGIWGDVNHGWK